MCLIHSLKWRQWLVRLILSTIIPLTLCQHLLLLLFSLSSSSSSHSSTNSNLSSSYLCRNNSLLSSNSNTNNSSSQWTLGHRLLLHQTLCFRLSWGNKTNSWIGEEHKLVLWDEEEEGSVFPNGIGMNSMCMKSKMEIVEQIEWGHHLEDL